MTLLIATTPTMEAIRAGIDIIAEDLREMERRFEHPEGRKGYRARSIDSELGIACYPKETIVISLPSAQAGGSIKVVHEASGIKLSVAVDRKALLTFRDTKTELPDAVFAALPGQPLSQLIDVSHASFAELADAPISNVFRPNNGWWSVYLNADIEAVEISKLVEGLC